MTQKRFRCGLVVGKFAPLHRGHELVLQTACAQCESVIALSYCKPELAGCEPARRRGWLEALFPDVRAVVLGEAEARAWGFELPNDSAPPEQHRTFVARVCHERLGTQVDAVFTSEDYGQPFADALTRYHREQGLACERPVAHVAVDPERRQIPVSATLIRGALYQHRQWLSAVVYAAFIRRVVMLGPESSGKTTLARALALAHRTRHVEEYGRELWLRRRGNLDAADLLSIARRQAELEARALPQCRDFLFCDTSPLTTAVYSRLMFGNISPELEAFAQREYDLTVYCAPDFPFVQDGTRVGPEFRARQDALTRAELERREIRYIEARGSVAQRVRQVSREASSRPLGGTAKTPRSPGAMVHGAPKTPPG